MDLKRGLMLDFLESMGTVCIGLSLAMLACVVFPPGSLGVACFPCQVIPGVTGWRRWSDDLLPHANV